MLSEAQIRERQQDSLLTSLDLLTRHVASIEGRRVRMLAERFDMLLAEDPLGTRYHDMAVRSLAAEIAAAGHVSPSAADSMLHRAHTIATLYPRVLTALEDGLITLRHAEVIANAGSALDDCDDETRAEYERRALDVAFDTSSGRTEAQVKMIAADIAELDVAERQRRARDAHGVWAGSMRDGLGVLEVTGPEHLTRAAFDRADAIAKSIIADRDDDDDDERTLDQVRTDVVLELLIGARSDTMIGTPAEAIRAAIQVTISADTLAGRDDRMAQLDGFGPLLPEDARLLAAEENRWAQLFLDPQGIITCVDTYSPTEQMKRHLRARDQHCRFPGCARPARRCEIDHTFDWALGGETEIDNLAHLCVKHHSLKHPDVDERHRWMVRQLGGGVLEWTSPTGQISVDCPTPRVAFV